MVGLCGMMLAFAVLIGLATYWISWEVQDKTRRPGFTKMLWSDITRLLRWESGGIPVFRTLSIAAQSELSSTPAPVVTGK